MISITLTYLIGLSYLPYCYLIYCLLPLVTSMYLLLVPTSLPHHSPTFHLPYGAGTAGERMVSGGEGGGMARTPRIHPAYRSYFLGSVVLSSHSPPVTPFRAHFVHSPLRAVGEWNETEDVSGERTEHERERSEPRTERSRYGRGKELMNGGFYYGFYGFLLLFS